MKRVETRPSSSPWPCPAPPPTPSPTTLAQLITDSNYDYSESKERQVHDPSLINAAVDSDYAGDTTHCKSVTDLSIQMAGGTILYKTRFQDTIALSSTEAEFNAAAEAGKYILY